MKQVYYTGPYDEGVDLPLPYGGAVHADPGEPIEVNDDFAERLLEQGDIWATSPDGNTEPPAPEKKTVELANKLGVDLSTVVGSGKKGRIVQKDVKAAAESTPPDGANPPDEGATEGE